MFRHLRLDLVVTTSGLNGSEGRDVLPLRAGAWFIRQAVDATEPTGHLQVRFLGRDLIRHADRIDHWMTVAREESDALAVEVDFVLAIGRMTAGPMVRHLLFRPDVTASLRCDDPEGLGHVAAVWLGRLVAAGHRPVSRILVSPGILPELVEMVDRLRDLGISRTDLELDLWSSWSAGDIDCLVRAVDRLAARWHARWQHEGLNWFDPRLAADFDGVVAVSPSGRLFDCPRMVGRDEPDHPYCLDRMPVHREGPFPRPVRPGAVCCDGWGVAPGRTSPCTNFARTGLLEMTDSLLDAWLAARHRAKLVAA